MPRTLRANYVPYFGGKNNTIKYKVWLMLLGRYLNRQSGLKLSQMSELLSCNYYSLAVLLGRWVKWGYVGFRKHPGGRIYQIRSKGREWLERWQSIIPTEGD